MNILKEPKLGRLRSFFWPIHNYELKKVLPMFMLFFLISFIYNLMRCLKITLVVTAPNANSSVIPFLKIFFVLPGAFLFIYIFTKLSNYYNREKIFYIMVGIFLSVFSLFLFVLYPLRDFLSLDAIMALMDWRYFPKGMEGLLIACKNWSFSLFYSLCELWGTVVLSMLFWGFANEVTSMNEATRFYSIFALAANLSGIFSGCFGTFCNVNQPLSWLPYKTAWEQTLFLQVSLVILFGLIIIGVFRWINKNVYISTDFADFKTIAQTKTKINQSEKLSLRECLKYLSHSRYIIYVVILVASYNLVYNLADVLLAESANSLFTNSNEFNAFMNYIAILTGCLAVIFAIIISGNVIRYFGWVTAAIIAPCVWLITTAGFFACLFSQGNWFGQIIAGLFSSPLHLAVYFGAAQLCFGRSTKYTVFDETKEIAFVPLSQFEQRKGKAVVEGLVSRIGKSSGSFVILVLLSIFGEISAAIPYIAAIMFAVIGIWMFAIFKLGDLVNKAINPDLALAELPESDLVQANL